MKASRNIGWYEEYRCGCLSESVATKEGLLGYCSKHGADRKQVYRDFQLPGMSAIELRSVEIRLLVRARLEGFELRQAERVRRRLLERKRPASGDAPAQQSLFEENCA